MDQDPRRAAGSQADAPEQDDFGAARGIAIGSLFGGILWSLIGLALWGLLGHG